MCLHHKHLEWFQCRCYMKIGIMERKAQVVSEWLFNCIESIQDFQCRESHFFPINSISNNELLSILQLTTATEKLACQLNYPKRILPEWMKSMTMRLMRTNINILNQISFKTGWYVCVLFQINMFTFKDKTSFGPDENATIYRPNSNL